jgi:hypothetical protein
LRCWNWCNAAVVPRLPHILATQTSGKIVSTPATKPTASADELLGRMLAKVDQLCLERDRLVGEQRRKYPGTNKVINGPAERRFR